MRLAVASGGGSAAASDARAAARVLVVGPPRSGTTWVGRALATSPGAVYVHEPDNFDVDLFAGVAKVGLGPYPVLQPGDRAPAYATLWRLAFRGGWPGRRPVTVARSSAARLPRGLAIPALRLLGAPVSRIPPSADRVVAKSVHACLSAEWVAAATGARVVVVRRHPLNMVASWLDLGFRPWGLDREPVVARLRALGLPETPPSGDLAGLVAWGVGVHAAALEEARARHPEWTVVEHEWLCGAPVERFASLFASLGLPWHDDVERFLVESDCDGSGMRVVRRRAAEQPGRWRRRLDAAQVATAQDVLAGFGILPAAATG